MKIQAIRALVKEEKRCVIYTNVRGRQWIGTGTCMFLGEENVKLTEDAMPGLLDLNETEQDKIRFEEMDYEESAIATVPRLGENQMEDTCLEIKWHGTVWLALRCNGKTYLVSLKKVKTAGGVDEYRQFFLARNRWNAPLIVVNDGMVHSGVIAPLNQESTEEVMAELRRISFGQAEGWEEASAPGEEFDLEDEPEGEQMTMEDADGETDSE